MPMVLPKVRPLFSNLDRLTAARVSVAAGIGPPATLGALQMTQEAASIRRLIEDAELARSEVVHYWRKAEGERREQLERQIERLDDKIEKLTDQLEECC